MGDPYPLLLQPQVFEKVWGGRRLERLGKVLPPGRNIGESWEVADLPATSAQGAGGRAVRSVIRNGPLAGRTLHDALDLWGTDLLGGATTTPEGNFPLLVKFLDAKENLSVQVHPSPDYARDHPGAAPKTECWYVIHAEPRSVLYTGLREGVGRAELERSLREGRLRDVLAVAEARPGTCHTLPSGTVHALGAGVLVAEVQTPSDTTYRLDDWGRSGRALQVEEALACALPGRGTAPARVAREGGLLADTEAFRVLRAPPEAEVGTRCLVVVVLRGSGRVETKGGEPLDLETGACCVIPANLSGHVGGTGWEALLITPRGA